MLFLRRPAAATAVAAVVSLLSIPVFAQNSPVTPALSSSAATAEQRRVLDIEKLRAVPAGRAPNDVPTCDVLVMGGGLGGVAAAEALARQGVSVILVEPTSKLGGQLTAQGVATPDENRFIEQERGGPGSRSYRELREQARAYYATQPGIVPGRAQNVGQPWVSRVSAEPAVWEQAIRERLAPLQGPRGIRRILLRSQIVEVRRFPGNGRFSYADVVDLDSGRITRIGAQFFLDATEMGDGLALAGAPWTVGQEPRSAFNEPHAPEEAHPEWIQSLTYCFAVRWTPEAPRTTRFIVEKPAEYDYFKSLGEYTLDYVYSDARGVVPYKVFARAPGAGGPFWTYRRLIAASSFKENPAYASDLSLINWRGNDFHEENPIGKTVDEQIRILQRAKAFAQGFLYWLQTECPRDDGSGIGYPEMQLDRAAMGSEDGFAAHPYIRESRRLLSEFILTENHLVASPASPEQKTGEAFFDSVGIALYAIDIHPAKGEPPLLAPALPYHLPLGAFIPRPGDGPPNVLPAAKNFGATRLALASARMHPTEWLAGEIAGHLAAFCLRDLRDPAQRRLEPTEVRNTPDLLSAFQDRLRAGGITTHWSDALTEPPPSPPPR